jgi:alkanesulfonate monooxygenase SsuD/methylene tetrahydromethanopterin reductase-like flavin-dependent oxidoreductase (luciferase family)
MKVGILVEAEEGLDWDSWRATYSAADQLGFDSVWLSDHLQSPWPAARHGLEPWTALAVAAAETRLVTLGPLVSPITFREPAIVARMAETLDGLSGGRFVIGLGLGWNADEHAAAGISFPSVIERSRRLTDGIDRIRCELGSRRIPILIGGKGIRSTLPVVARSADEWNLTTASPLEFERASAEVDRLCREVGRNPSEIGRSAAMGVLMGRDAVELAQRADNMRRCVPPLSEPDDVLEAARRMGWVVGTPEEVIASLRGLAAAGVDRAILGHYDLSQTAVLELLSQTVLPAVM